MGCPVSCVSSGDMLSDIRVGPAGEYCSNLSLKQPVQ